MDSTSWRRCCLPVCSKNFLSITESYSQYLLCSGRIGSSRDSDQVSLRRRARTRRRPRPRHNLILLLRQRDAVDRPLDGRQLEVVGICCLRRVHFTIFRPWFLRMIITHVHRRPLPLQVLLGRQSPPAVLLGALHLYLLLSLTLERPNAIRLHPLPLFGC